MPGILVSALYDLFFKQSFYFIYACVYTAYVHACLHSCVNVGMHTCHGVQPWVFVLAFHPVWDRVSLSLAGLSLWRFSYLRLPSPCKNAGITDVPDTQPAFAQVLGIWIQVLTFVTSAEPTKPFYQPYANYFTQFSHQFQFYKGRNSASSNIICTGSQVVKQGFRSRLLLSQ